MKIKSGFYLKSQELLSGFILLEVIISIFLFGFIILGSFYSYSFVHQRLQRQHQHRIALSQLQGLMEQTRSYLIKIASDPGRGPEFLMDPVSLKQIEEKLYDGNSMSGIFDAGPNIIIDMNLTTSENKKFINIELSATLNNLPIRLYTQISPYIHKNN